MNAGFRVVGIDNKPQPRYCGDGFIQMDALEFLERVRLGEFEPPNVIHASPPCQWITHAAIQWRAAGREYPDRVEPIRRALQATGLPYVIEQPVGRVLNEHLLLNGAMFSLRVRRNRYFETRPALPFHLLPQDERPAKMGRPFDARSGQLFYPVGHFSGVAQGRAAMGIDWYMTGAEVAQAIPPAYTAWLGAALLAAVNHAMP